MANRVVTEIVSIPKPISFKEAKTAVLRVAAYARVSTNHEKQQTSLAAQMEYYQKLIKERPGWSFVKIYADDGVSGLDTRHRIGFTSMIEDCLAGLVDLILTKSIYLLDIRIYCFFPIRSRFARAKNNTRFAKF